MREEMEKKKRKRVGEKEGKHGETKEDKSNGSDSVEEMDVFKE